MTKKQSKITIDEQFDEIIREKMSNKEFWKWVSEWYDPQLIIESTENWDEQDKLDLINDYNN